MKNEKILILDFGGLNNQTVARIIRDCQVYCEVHPYTMSIEDIKKFNPKGIVLVDDFDKQVNKTIKKMFIRIPQHSKRTSKLYFWYWNWIYL